MAEYVILIYNDEQSQANATAEMMTEVMNGHIAFAEQNEATLLGGKALQGTRTSTSLRKNSEGEFIISDGPFLETKEGLGGFYQVEAASLDEAIEIAKGIPAWNGSGGVEIRPARVFD
jgi:hypothetical protein